MRIVFDVSYIQKNRAGIGRHAIQLLSSLLRADSSNEYILHGWSLGLDKATVASMSGPRVKLSTARIPGAVKRLYWNTLRTPPMEALVGDFDIFHSADPALPPTRTKTICTVHDLSYVRLPHLFEKNVLALEKAVRRAVQNANAVIVPSDQTKLDLIELLKVPAAKIHRVYLPVSEIFTPVPDTQFDQQVRKQFQIPKPYILFVGTLEPRKNIATLIAAYELALKERNADVDLVIVGKRGWLYKKIFAAMKNSRVRERIHYLDYVLDSELASLYRQALMFVYPSQYEGYGFPVLEAMSSGIPIITSGNSSMRELADGVALLVDPESVEGIAEAMGLLLHDEVRRVEMRQRGEMVVRKISSDTAAQVVLGVYDMLAGQREGT